MQLSHCFVSASLGGGGGERSETALDEKRKFLCPVKNMRAETLITIIKKPPPIRGTNRFGFRQKRSGAQTRCLPVQELLVRCGQCRPSGGAPLRPRPMHPTLEKTHARARTSSSSRELDGRVGLRRHLRVRLPPWMEDFTRGGALTAQ